MGQLGAEQAGTRNCWGEECERKEGIYLSIPIPLIELMVLVSREFSLSLSPHRSETLGQVRRRITNLNPGLWDQILDCQPGPVHPTAVLQYTQPDYHSPSRIPSDPQ